MSDSKEIIQARLLSNVDDKYDKTEGSFFYDAEKPVSIELETAYAKQDEILNKGFADTATDVYLDRIIGERGMARKQATYATTTVQITGTENAVINIGDKVATDLINFSALESVTIGVTGIALVNVQADISGNGANVPVSAIKYFPVTLAGVVSVTNLVAVTNGYNGETDAELRIRYFEFVRTPATSGNVAHYKNWAKEVVGVGDARVNSLWAGNGTVKVIIINSNKRGADATLIADTATHIEDERPIGATVTVVSATEKAINITVTLVIDIDNYTLEDITSAIEANLIEYFKTIAFINTYVSYASVGNIIFNTDGVIDYNNLLVNTDTANITINDDEVAVLGGVVVG